MSNSKILTKDGNFIANIGNYMFAYMSPSGELIRETNRSEWEWASTKWGAPILELDATPDWAEDGMSLKKEWRELYKDVNPEKRIMTLRLRNAVAAITECEKSGVLVKVLRYARSLSTSLSDAIKGGAESANWISDPENQFANFKGYTGDGWFVYETLGGIACIIKVDMYDTYLQIGCPVGGSLEALLMSDGFRSAPYLTASTSFGYDQTLVTALARIIYPNLGEYTSRGHFVRTDYMFGNGAELKVYECEGTSTLYVDSEMKWINRGNQPSIDLRMFNSIPVASCYIHGVEE